MYWITYFLSLIQNLNYSLKLTHHSTSMQKVYPAFHCCLLCLYWTMGFRHIWKFSVCMFSWKFSDLTDIVLNHELQHFQASWCLKSVKIFSLCHCFSVRWASSSCLGAIFEPNFDLLISKDRPRLQRVPWGRGRTAQGSSNSHHFRKDSNEAHYKSSRQSHQVIFK